MSDVDAAKLPVMLNALRLPTIGRIWQEFGARADREGWGSARFLAALCEHELAERGARRIARHMAESGLPHGKTLRHLRLRRRTHHPQGACDGAGRGRRLDRARRQHADLRPQRHRQDPSGRRLRHRPCRQRQARAVHPDHRSRPEAPGGAARSRACPATLAKLDRFDVLVLDDLGYVRKDQAETNVLFELIAERYERTSLITTCNQPFSEWNQIFPDPAMTVAAIDRLVHHATILELNTESYRRRSALASGAKAAAAAARA